MFNNSAIGGGVHLYRASLQKSIASVIICTGLFSYGDGATAKEREPEPIENPGDCPVDAPIRVASIDSLRHFSGLIGHCPETTLIESPAYQANRPRGYTRHPNDLREPTNNSEATGAGRPDQVIVASAKARKSPTQQTSNQTRAGDYSVAIVPSPEAFRPINHVSTSAVAGEQSDIESILALRPQSYSTKFDQKIADAARTHRVDPLLLHAVIKQESGYRQRAVSHAGARGLMQVMPATGRALGVRNAQHLFDPNVNIDAGAKLLSQLWGRFDGNIDLVLAAYNAGEGAVRKHGMTVPPYRETRDYVVKVKANYRRLAGESGITVNF